MMKDLQEFMATRPFQGASHSDVMSITQTNAWVIRWIIIRSIIVVLSSFAACLALEFLAGHFDLYGFRGNGKTIAKFTRAGISSLFFGLSYCLSSLPFVGFCNGNKVIWVLSAIIGGAVAGMAGRTMLAYSRLVESALSVDYTVSFVVSIAIGVAAGYAAECLAFLVVKNTFS